MNWSNEKAINLHSSFGCSLLLKKRWHHRKTYSSAEQMHELIKWKRLTSIAAALHRSNVTRSWCCSFTTGRMVAGHNYITIRWLQPYWHELRHKKLFTYQALQSIKGLQPHDLEVDPTKDLREVTARNEEGTSQEPQLFHSSTAKKALTRLFLLLFCATLL
jgi:hypothetical protein